MAADWLHFTLFFWAWIIRGRCMTSLPSELWGDQLPLPFLRVGKKSPRLGVPCAVLGAEPRALHCVTSPHL